MNKLTLRLLCVLCTAAVPAVAQELPVDTDLTASLRAPVASRGPQEPAPLSLRTGGADPIFEGNCNESEKAKIVAALYKARAQAAMAAIGLAFLPEEQRPLSTRTTKWFGTYDRGRYEVVVRTFVAIYNGLAHQQITFICEPREASGCGSDVAFVSAPLHFRIHLCEPFLRLPDDGPESKPATLIHEMSHFRIIANTHDHCKGRRSCEDLAARDPWRAVDAADPYRFFAENDPYIPLRTDE